MKEVVPALWHEVARTSTFIDTKRPLWEGGLNTLLDQ